VGSVFEGGWSSDTFSLFTFGGIVSGKRSYSAVGNQGQNVRYLDYETDITAGETSEGLIAHTPGFFCKRKSFEHEREYRLVISLEETEAENTGLFIPVLLEQLIEKVVVSPNAPQWVAEVVGKEVAVHGLDVAVVQSDLYSTMLK
jgi:hypothetical protein